MNPKFIVIGLFAAAAWAVIGSFICIVNLAAGWAIWLAVLAVLFFFIGFRQAEDLREREEDREYYRHPRL